MYPFLCLSLAAFISRVYTKEDTRDFLLFLVLFLTPALNTLIQFPGMTLQAIRYTYLGSLLILFVVAFFTSGKIRFLAYRISIIAVLALIIESEITLILKNSTKEAIPTGRVTIPEEFRGVIPEIAPIGEIVSADLLPGLLVRGGQGDLFKIPEIAEYQSEPVLNFNYHEVQKPYQNPWWLWFHGYLKIPDDGHYYIATLSDDGSEILVNDIRVLEDWEREGIEFTSNKLFLKKGFYSLDIRYFDYAEGALLHVMVRPPGEEEFERIPNEWLFCDPDELNLEWEETEE